MTQTSQNSKQQTKYDPQDWATLLETFLDWKPQTYTTLPTRSSPTRVTQQDLFETENTYSLEVDVPGFSKEELSVVFDDQNRTIRISGDKTTAVNGFPKKRSVSVTYRLPQRVDVESVEARLENGVLYVVVPKSSPSVMTINIH